MKYKGKQVARHRYNQLKKTNENYMNTIASLNRIVITKQQYLSLLPYDVKEVN